MADIHNRKYFPVDKQYKALLADAVRLIKQCSSQEQIEAWKAKFREILTDHNLNDQQRVIKVHLLLSVMATYLYKKGFHTESRDILARLAAMIASDDLKERSHKVLTDFVECTGINGIKQTTQPQIIHAFDRYRTTQTTMQQQSTTSCSQEALKEEPATVTHRRQPAPVC